MIAECILIIGVGLIGGSLARALRESNSVGTIVGYDIDKSGLQEAQRLGVIDTGSSNIAEVVKDADIVVLATPLSAVDALFIEMSGTLCDKAVITDVGSVKAPVVALARHHLGNLFPRFVAGHPITGREKNGVLASSAQLFSGHKTILTPVAETDPEALNLITKMWQAVGASVTQLDIADHDAILAITSHLPHIIAYSLVDCLSAMEGKHNIFDYAAGGFSDFTRIASSQPRMWHDICIANSEQILAAINQFNHHLDNLRQAIEHNDSEKLMCIFEQVKISRDDFVNQNARKMRTTY